MKFKKVTSLLLASVIVSGLMVGCSKNETDKSNRLIEMRKKEVTEEKVDKNVENKEDKKETNTKEDTKEKQESKTKTETKNSQSNTKKEEVKQKEDNGYEYDDDDGTVLNKKYGDHLEEEAQKQDAEEEVEGDIGEAWHEHEEDDSVGNDNIGYTGESNGVTVYVNLDSGKFHKSANAHDMDGAVEMTRDDAEASGYSPCGNCYR